MSKAAGRGRLGRFRRMYRRYHAWRAPFPRGARILCDITFWVIAAAVAYVAVGTLCGMILVLLPPSRVPRTRRKQGARRRYRLERRQDGWPTQKSWTKDLGAPTVKWSPVMRRRRSASDDVLSCRLGRVRDGQILHRHHAVRPGEFGGGLVLPAQGVLDQPRPGDPILFVGALADRKVFCPPPSAPGSGP